MDLLILAGIGIVILLLSRQGGLLGGFGSPTGSPPPGQLGILPTSAQTASSSLASQVQLQSLQGQNSTITSLIHFGGAGLGTAIGIETGTIAASTGLETLGVGVAVGLAVMLWQQHEERMKDATDENSAWNIIYPDWVNSIQSLFNAYNSGQIDAPTMLAELDSLRALVYKDADKFKNEPGISWNSTIGLTDSQRIWQSQCNKACTIGCCLFNGVVGPNTARAKALVEGAPVAVFATGQQQMVTTNQFAVPAIQPNTTYGFQGASAFILSVQR